MLTANVFDHAARLRSFELAADVLRQLRVTTPVQRVPRTERR